MGKSQWTFNAVWSAFRDVASWGLGAYWGNQQMASPAAADPLKIALIATLLGLPFAFRADELRKQRSQPQEPSNNSQSPNESVRQ